ncbi:(3R)-hydroxymyristoyl-(acyl-carrier-protein) dehydratase [Alkalidesulfovibrio alkalitolerans DSM 16529]|jgi:3-hydroxyacyl-[acyl-carrier-protein] dehydratase|uniref:3-hydroxyacyl-[acyl-carrier-protein] dehydratase FabZ n=1 Tax=Alkalidesulfovibrio alkalitolerans DSM 16529 TaxID=1121439 RepID=S7UE62_9BACT|nr:3-hydroxyacyl-ACP dehydratase FabZ [Alkalidesulfovibrio alkalitolerans]EPR30523.1 (3R)-hydroxymyristoyl-(acyl-carrier-protein) dehydratase [Alkalidesulfovibrio alkalitolerans DSM 16529]
MTHDASRRVDVRQIMEYIPHRYPFLLVDRVVEYTPGESLVAIKNVTINEPFFQGHFPGLPVMPGVLMIEAMAQAGGVLVFKSFDLDLNGKLFMFTGIDKVKFRRPVTPGDQLVLRLSDLKRKFTLFKMHGQALVDGEVAAEADLSAALVESGDI